MKRPANAFRALPYVSTWETEGRRYWRFRKGGRSVMLPDPAEDAGAFTRAYEEALDGRTWTEPLEGQTSPDGRPLELALIRGARGRAGRYGLAFSIDEDWFRAQFSAQHGLCAISGLPMVKREKKRDPWSPSIDRKIPSLGYTPANCQLVCAMVNYAKNQYDIGTLIKMCRAVLSHQAKAA